MFFHLKINCNLHYLKPFIFFFIYYGLYSLLFYAKKNLFSSRFNVFTFLSALYVSLPLKNISFKLLFDLIKSIYSKFISIFNTKFLHNRLLSLVVF